MSVIEALKSKLGGPKHYSWANEVLRRKNKLVVPNDVKIRDNIL